MQGCLADSSDSTAIVSNKESPGRKPLHADLKPCTAGAMKVAADQTSKAFKTLWQSYRSVVLRYNVPLELADEAIERLVFWIPYHEANNGSGPPWREVLYSLLSLNRLSMHCALKPEIGNSYGTTLRANNPNIPATSIRIALTVIHSLMPSLLEMIPSDSFSRSKRQAILRLRLEQIKFGLRFVLLVSNWKQSINSKEISGVGVGILRDGGMYHVDQTPGLAVKEAQAIRKRQYYAGRRTGLTVTKQGQRHPKPQSLSHLILGELLYILRPLYWASAEAKHHPEVTRETSSSFSSGSLLKTLAVTLAMDLTSLGLLSSQRENVWSVEEWNRRGMKLFLYLLRSPIWSRITSPMAERSSSVIRNIPILGTFIDSYLWDWIIYSKHPYVAEEG